MATNRFNVGDIVYLIAEPSKVGSVIELLSPVKEICRYKVFHSGTEIKIYFEEQIDIFKEDDVVSNIIEPSEFLARLTSINLQNPLTDSIYSFSAARIKFIPFQFKPLLRFLKSEQPRLLIADDVGVGKTIEAGLIMRELQSRQELKNILIVCPKSLVNKWKYEMKRFDEDFRPLTSETLKYCIRETDLDGVWPQQYNKSIVHLELLRRDETIFGNTNKKKRPGLLTLNPPPKFDLTIIDEAHHLRNPDTNTHEIARFLCQVSEAVLFLTATPIQLGAQNLFTLLNLLRPDYFLDEETFNLMIEPNRFINQAVGLTRAKVETNWMESVSKALKEASSTSWGKDILLQDPRFTNWLSYFSSNKQMSDENRIDCIRDLEELNSLSMIMNRTRRRDIGFFTMRVPKTVSVPYTAEEQMVYNKIIEFKRELIKLHQDPSIIGFVLTTIERQAASCLHALVPLIDTFISTGKFSTSSFTDDLDIETQYSIEKDIIELANGLKVLAANLSDNDPKYDNLLEILNDTISNIKGKKILVFSYYINTLKYLFRKMVKQGFRVALITGEVEEYEREDLRDRFRLDSEDERAIDILLSSEVGSEGLDFEFCTRLVNFDIPWNPMKIEQRIGRIDRLGQKSEKIQIFNFITPGTIEERIFYRCYERLGIFKNTIGDLEEILGDITDQINKAVLDINLSTDQLEQKAQILTDNILLKLAEQRRIEEESIKLIGIDKILDEEINEIKDKNKYISSFDLINLISTFLNFASSSSKLVNIPRDENRYVLRANKSDKEILRELTKPLKVNSQLSEFVKWLESNELTLELTFNQEYAAENKMIPFITPIHPLSKIAARYFKVNKNLYTQIKIVSDKYPKGRYLFSYFLWEIISLRSDCKIIPIVIDLNNNCLAEKLSAQISSIFIDPSCTTSNIPILDNSLINGLVIIDEVMYEKRKQEIELIRTKNKLIAEQKLISLSKYHENRITRVNKELRTATDDRIKRMKESEKNRIELEYNSKKKEIKDKEEADIVCERIAFGTIEII